ncbi:MAG: glycoside hydrolase family 3 protein, partial [Granulosicoccus sp.]|nr:glycoside hydrolase family 3 protein [Granulosicoccus sp.]
MLRSIISHRALLAVATLFTLLIDIHWAAAAPPCGTPKGGPCPPDPTALIPKCGLSGSVQARVQDCIAMMDLDDKIGQMAMGDHLELKGEDHVVTFKLGALLAGGGHSPTTGNQPDDWRKMVDGFQQDALSTDLGIPLLFGIDAIHGHNNVFGATIFPHNIGLGAAGNPELGCEIGRVTAKEVAATGINWNFSPTLCVSRDERWGRSYECFGETPEAAATMTSIIGGYQGTGECTHGLGLSATDTVLATAKHWIGDGGTTGGEDQGDTPSSEIEAFHLPPYLPAINIENVGSVMISYSSVDGVKMHANPDQLVSGRLKDSSTNGGLDFSGIVLSDWAAIKQIDRNFTVAIEQAINGGIDMAMEPYNYDSFVRNLTSLVETGSVSQQRIDNAVERILTAKVELGLFDPPYGRLFADSGQMEPIDQTSISDIGSADHRVVARQAVSESLVLLKNTGDIFPVDIGSNSFKIIVAGKSADDIGNQSGGWTIDWQGDSGDI